MIEYYVLRLLHMILRNMPYELAVRCGGRITDIAWNLGIRRYVARTNFGIVFGDKYTPSERDRILRLSYKNFGRSMVELALQTQLSPLCLREIVDISEADVLGEVADENHGALLVSGHLGSWELLGSALVAHKFPIDFLVGNQSNKRVDDMVNGIRKRMTIGVIHTGVAARGVLRSLKNGRFIALLSDQDGGHSNVEVEMFGHKVMAPGGPAAFHLKTGAPIIVGMIVRNKDKLTHKVIADRLHIPALTGENDEDIATIAQLYTNTLATFIQTYPEMWLWAHRRFKKTVDY